MLSSICDERNAQKTQKKEKKKEIHKKPIHLSCLNPNYYNYKHTYQQQLVEERRRRRRRRGGGGGGGQFIHLMNPLQSSTLKIYHIAQLQSWFHFRKTTPASNQSMCAERPKIQCKLVTSVGQLPDLACQNHWFQFQLNTDQTGSRSS